VPDGAHAEDWQGRKARRAAGRRSAGRPVLKQPRHRPGCAPWAAPWCATPMSQRPGPMRPPGVKHGPAPAARGRAGAISTVQGGQGPPAVSREARGRAQAAGATAAWGGPGWAAVPGVRGLRGAGRGRSAALESQLAEQTGRWAGPTVKVPTLHCVAGTSPQVPHRATCLVCPTACEILAATSHQPMAWPD
jgi:hypothetical protein